MLSTVARSRKTSTLKQASPVHFASTLTANDMYGCRWTLIVGAGPVGMATSQFALADGGKVIALDVVQPRLDFLKAEIGANQVDGDLSVS